METKFEVTRHNDRSYEAPDPWDRWDTYANCWTCRHCGAAAGYQLHNPGCRRSKDGPATTLSTASGIERDVVCPCYGCTIERQRDGIPQPDRTAEPCSPPDACAKDGQCWTHSEWIDEAACDPPSACARRLSCGAHGDVRS